MTFVVEAIAIIQPNSGSSVSISELLDTDSLLFNNVEGARLHTMDKPVICTTKVAIQRTLLMVS